MLCIYCNNPVSSKAVRCDACHKTVKYSFKDRTREKPNCTVDMCEKPVFRIPIDEKKNYIRNNYIKNLYEYKKQEEWRAEKKKQYRKMLIGILFWFLFLIIPLSIMAIGAHFNSALCILFGLIIAIGSLFLFLLPGELDKNKIKTEQKTLLHNTKPYYYANNHVIGYVYLYSRTTDDNGTTYTYATCEVAKQNIQSITYDSKFGEYVLMLKRPIYTHHDFPVEYEMRLQDVFDDTVLTNALGCTLPPKDIPF